MIDVIHFRSWVFWWGALTASLFISDWLKQIADFFRGSEIFQKDKLPFSIVPGINGWIDGLANQIPASIQFNPNQEIAKIGTFVFTGWMLALFFGALIFIFSLQSYRRALRSSAWFDDFFAIFLIYVVFRVETHIIAFSKQPILEGVRAFLNNPTTAFLTMLVLTLFLVFFGEGFRSKHAFWRAVVEISLVALVMFPNETADAFGWVFERFAIFGAYLKDHANVSFAAIWGIIGIVLAWRRLILPEPGEGGGGGGGGGKGGGGGGLKLKLPWKKA